MAITFSQYHTGQWANDTTTGTAIGTFNSPQFYTANSTTANSNRYYQFDFNTSAQTTTSATFTTDWVGTGGRWFSDGFQSFGGKYYELKNALMQIFKGPDEKLWKDLTPDEKKMFKAKKTSEKLLKTWLSTNEWKSLKEKGEIEIPAIDESNCIYIVRKDPNARVIVQKDGKKSHELCVVSKDLELPVGDQLLSKILLVKHNQKKFKELGVRY